MVTKTRLVLKPEVKLAILLIAVALVFYGVRREEAIDEELVNYVACIKDQADKHGWIVRSNCSNDWERLDAMAGFSYRKGGSNIYLVE